MAAALGAGISGGNGSQKAEAATAIAEDRRQKDLSYQSPESPPQRLANRGPSNPMAARSAQHKTLEAEIRRLPDLEPRRAPEPLESALWQPGAPVLAPQIPGAGGRISDAGGSLWRPFELDEAPSPRDRRSCAPWKSRRCWRRPTDQTGHPNDPAVAGRNPYRHRDIPRF